MKSKKMVKEKRRMVKKGVSIYSFRKGLDQLRVMDVPTVKSEIMSALGITTKPSWSLWLNGRQDPHVSDILAIEAVFEKYGITDIWGGES
jgi:hypothetical protein